MEKLYNGIIGLAVGDALGVPVEFKSRLEIAENPVVSMRGYGTHAQPAGTWSDDTSLTLALLDSIIKKKKVDYVDIMDKFSAWLMGNAYTATGEVFDIGNSTRTAIANYRQGIEPLKCGGTSECENGNGSLMRILPLAYYLREQWDDTMEARMELVHNVSALTHRHPISLIGCGIYINIALRLLGDDADLYMGVDQGIKESFEYYDNKLYDEVRSYARLRDLSAFLKLPEKEIKSSGYVVDTLEAALWCLLNTDSYKDCVLKAVNLGADTDTVGAVAGGLAGIYYGADKIPEEWLEIIARKEYIEELCDEGGMSVERKGPGCNPWEGLYGEMHEKCPQNETERKISEMLSKGCSITECMKVTGIAWKDMKEYYHRLEKWEIEHLCVRVPKSDH